MQSFRRENIKQKKKILKTWKEQIKKREYVMGKTSINKKQEKFEKS